MALHGGELGEAIRREIRRGDAGYLQGLSRRVPETGRMLLEMLWAGELDRHRTAATAGGRCCSAV